MSAWTRLTVAEAQRGPGFKAVKQTVSRSVSCFVWT